MTFASATDLAIAVANERGDLRFVERPSRFGGTFYAIEDAVGVIEVYADYSAALARTRQAVGPAKMIRPAR